MSVQIYLIETLISKYPVICHSAAHILDTEAGESVQELLPVS